ncbi:hypothetical protein [Pseudomonas paeninsulae]|uniref:hypothetical protein n=1 Tax=Pseudomonas paeninsulae TaxID=3110772 RepID=UPI002D7842C9|nr:hypothetical protein [Pseudomonas sp. IT1137]
MIERLDHLVLTVANIINRMAAPWASQHQPATLPAAPPSLTSAKSVLTILAVFAVVLIAYGFA